MLQAGLLFFALYALFGDDIRTAATEKQQDLVFVVLSAITLAIFAAEFLWLSVTKPDYASVQCRVSDCKFFSLYFWLDALSMASVVLDILAVTGQLGGLDESAQNANIARSSRASRIGARLGRVLRVSRLIRFSHIGRLTRYLVAHGQDCSCCCGAGAGSGSSMLSSCFPCCCGQANVEIEQEGSRGAEGAGQSQPSTSKEKQLTSSSSSQQSSSSSSLTGSNSAGVAGQAKEKERSKQEEEEAAGDQDSSLLREQKETRVGLELTQKVNRHVILAVLALSLLLSFMDDASQQSSQAGGAAFLAGSILNPLALALPSLLSSAVIHLSTHSTAAVGPAAAAAAGAPLPSLEMALFSLQGCVVAPEAYLAARGLLPLTASGCASLSVAAGVRSSAAGGSPAGPCCLAMSGDFSVLQSVQSESSGPFLGLAIMALQPDLGVQDDLLLWLPVEAFQQAAAVSLVLPGPAVDLPPLQYLREEEVFLLELPLSMALRNASHSLPAGASCSLLNNSSSSSMNSSSLLRLWPLLQEDASCCSLSGAPQAACMPAAAAASNSSSSPLLLSHGPFYELGSGSYFFPATQLQQHGSGDNGSSSSSSGCWEAASWSSVSACQSTVPSSLLTSFTLSPSSSSPPAAAAAASSLYSLEVVAVFDRRSESRLSSLWNIGFTLLVLCALGLGSLLFSWDIHRLILGPLELIVALVRRVSNNPLLPPSQLADMAGCAGGGGLQAGSASSSAAAAALSLEASLSKLTAEMQLLARTVSNMGSLLRMGFGQEGAAVLAAALDSQSELDTLAPGKPCFLYMAYICLPQGSSRMSELLLEDYPLLLNALAPTVQRLCRGLAGGVVLRNTANGWLLAWPATAPAASAGCVGSGSSSLGGVGQAQRAPGETASSSSSSSQVAAGAGSRRGVTAKPLKLRADPAFSCCLQIVQELDRLLQQIASPPVSVGSGIAAGAGVAGPTVDADRKSVV